MCKAESSNTSEKMHLMQTVNMGFKMFCVKFLVSKIFSLLRESVIC